MPNFIPTKETRYTVFVWDRNPFLLLIYLLLLSERSCSWCGCIIFDHVCYWNQWFSTLTEYHCSLPQLQKILTKSDTPTSHQCFTKTKKNHIHVMFLRVYYILMFGGYDLILLYMKFIFNVLSQISLLYDTNDYLIWFLYTGHYIF